MVPYFLRTQGVSMYEEEDPFIKGVKFVGKGWAALTVAGLVVANPPLTIGLVLLGLVVYGLVKAIKGLGHGAKYLVDKRHDGKMAKIYAEDRKRLAADKAAEA